MQAKKLSAFIFAYAIYAATSSLFAQPYGYPYDAYNFPADPYRTYNAPYYNPPLNRPYYPGYPSRPPLGRPIRPMPRPYMPPDLYADGLNDSDKESVDPNSAESKIDQILNFWFGNLSSPTQFPANKISLWEGTPQGDRAIKERFLIDYQQAVLGHYGSWRDTPEGRLALIILLDQFPRHIYPDQPQMFTSDAMARGLALEGIQIGADQHLYPIERAFFYMPLQHSENPQMQAMSTDQYQRIVAQSPPSMKPIMQEFLRLAIKHREVIDRFGRFPHRNIILGRESTPEEKVYLGHKAAFRY